MQAQQEQAPIYHDLNHEYFDSLSNDFILSACSPYELGEKLGEEWVATAGIDAVHYAACRHTTNYQIACIIEAYCDHLVNEAEPDEYVYYICLPTENDGFCSPEIYKFFRQAKETYFMFQMEISPSSDDGRYLSQFGISTKFLPNQYFRDFEEGWSKSVRLYLRSILEQVDIS